MKSFEEYLDDGVVVKVSIDSQRARSLLLESERKLNSMNESIEKIGVKDENANDFVEWCYDIVMYLIRAKLLLKGYNSSGKGAHEAEIAYLDELGYPEYEVRMLNDLRYYRNGIMYYGKRFDRDYAEKIIAFTKKIIAKLKKKT